MIALSCSKGKLEIVAVTVFLWLFISIAHGQTNKVKEYYPNGSLKFVGKYKPCLSRDAANFVDVFEKRKSGKWIYYYPSGKVMRIENHAKLKSCNTRSMKEGEWEYFSESGDLYKIEKYQSDTMIYSEYEIYKGDTLFAQVTTYGESQNIIYFREIGMTNNLIENPKFKFYNFKSTHIEFNGQSQIEEQIPYWYSPDKATPDYYNRFRTVKGVYNDFEEEIGAESDYGYVGLMLYFHPNSRFHSWEPESETKYGSEYVYSEALQTKLKQELKTNHRYCIRLRIKQSGNAGYSVNKLGIYFSENEIRFKPDDFPGPPQVVFTLADGGNNSDWEEYCAEYMAAGEECFLTVGRFSHPDSTILKRRIPDTVCELDINNSAYYLLDNLELFELFSATSCDCNTRSKLTAIATDSIVSKFSQQLNDPDGEKIILDNVQFDFDDYHLLGSSEGTLEILYDYLEKDLTRKIFIVGHTDNEGTDVYNKELSLKRAESVKKWLVKKGISPKRVSCQGKGFDEPITNNLNEHLRSKNRRVELKIYY